MLLTRRGATQLGVVPSAPHRAKGQRGRRGLRGTERDTLIFKHEWRTAAAGVPLRVKGKLLSCRITPEQGGGAESDIAAPGLAFLARQSASYSRSPPRKSWIGGPEPHPFSVELRSNLPIA